MEVVRQGTIQEWGCTGCRSYILMIPATGRGALLVTGGNEDEHLARFMLFFRVRGYVPYDGYITDTDHNAAIWLRKGPRT